MMKRFIFHLIILSGLINIAGFEISAQTVAPANQTQTPRVEKVEPPNWWANHSMGTIRCWCAAQTFKMRRSVQKRISKSFQSQNDSGAAIIFFSTSRFAENASPQNTISNSRRRTAKRRFRLKFRPRSTMRKNFQRSLATT
jgi:hypothetical protein